MCGLRFYNRKDNTKICPPGSFGGVAGLPGSGGCVASVPSKGRPNGPMLSGPVSFGIAVSS